MNSPKALRIDLEQGVNVIALGSVYENIDESSMEQLRPFLKDEAARIDPPRLVLEMSGVGFFGSSFIELLFVVSSLLSVRKGAWAICGLSPHCAEVIHITHLDQVWTVRESLAEAIDAIKA